MSEAARIERIEIPVPFPPGNRNCCYIPDSIPTLIDSGINTPEGLRSLQDGLKKRGARISDVRRIILTHGHVDHAGAAGVIVAAGVPVFVHCRDKYWGLLVREYVRVRTKKRDLRPFLENASRSSKGNEHPQFYNGLFGWEENIQWLAITSTSTSKNSCRLTRR